MRNCIIILAAGVGNRFERECPKQFVILGNLPIVMQTINAYYLSSMNPDIILVLNKDYLEFWNTLCAKYNFDVPHQIVLGGRERFHSVKNALEAITNYDFVGIHDGVRPFISDELISKTFFKAYELGNATPAVLATNTIRFYDKIRASKSLDRDKIYVIQNPQIFRLNEIKDAYRQEYTRLFTDDAAVAEHYGIQINLIEGDRINIKITHPIDMPIALGIFNYLMSEELQNKYISNT